MLNVPFFIFSTFSLLQTKGAVSKSVVWKIGKILILFIVIVAAYFIGNKTAAVNNATVSKINLTQPKFSKSINKEFSFPVQDDKGNEVTKLTYTIQSAQLQDQIILQGQKADAVNGRTFLILNLKIANPSTQSMQLNSRDFIRVSLGSNPELLAPEIHNDPVNIQPISTKYTRVGLPIDESVTNVKIHVGEINGQKTVIDLHLK